MCSKKKLTQTEAIYILAFIENNRHKDVRRDEQRWYFCKHCNAYHFTSKEYKK